MNTFRTAIALTSIIAPLVLLMLIWRPEVTAYRVEDRPATSELLAGSLTAPSDTVLKEIGTFSYLMDLDRPAGDSLVSQARLIPKGRLPFAGVEPDTFVFPFAGSDFTEGNPTRQLTLAGLNHADLLLDAYAQSGERTFLKAAAEIVTAFGEYEQSVWVTHGLLYNPHAIAARVRVLTRLWRYLRMENPLDTVSAERLLTMAVRSGALLRKPSLFRYATNHGLMQNLALLQLAVTFPRLPQMEACLDTALNRLRLQMSFFMDDEGVVLEHSAGYHLQGMQLVGSIFRCLTLLDVPVPKEWIEKYNGGLEFLAMLRRPDGSLPFIGDTETGIDRHFPTVTAETTPGRFGPLKPFSLQRPGTAHQAYPIAGYSIWWHVPDGDTMAANQTVAAWSYFPGRAHKSADEMSVLWWADGRSVWTNVGYWPYGDSLRSRAVSWHGSNAPHVRHEPRVSLRQSFLVSEGYTDSLAILDLVRIGPGKTRVRRQLLRLGNRRWLVLDDGKHLGDSLVAVWRAAPGVRILPEGRSGSFTMIADGWSQRIEIAAAGPAYRVVRAHGGDSSSVERVAVDLKPVMVDALRLTADMNNPAMLLAWQVEPAAKNSTTDFVAVLSAGSTAENWTVELTGGDNIDSVRRYRDTISWYHRGRKPFHLALHAMDTATVRAVRQRLQARFRSVGARYHEFVSRVEYRANLSWFLLSLLLVQEIVLFVIKRWRCAIVLRLAAILGWVVIGITLFTRYL